MRDLRTTASTAADEEAPVTDSVGAPALVELLPVVGSVSAPILGEPGPEALGADVDPAIIAASAVDVPWSTLRGVTVPPTTFAVPLGVATVVSILTGQPSLGLLVCVTGWLGLVSRRVRFTFGEGFVGYRPDPRWPRGVQEDDDVRWDWRAPGAESDVDEREPDPAR